jgi:hypothetical protein
VYYLRSSEPAPSPFSRSPVADARWTRSVVLYFGDPAGGSLVPESREVLSEGSTEASVARVVRELLRGSQARNVSLLNPKCELRSVFVKSDGGLVLDFDGPLFPPGAGEIPRWLALQSLLRALHESFPAIDGLSILSNGLPISAAENRLSIPDRISLQELFSEVKPS